MMSALRQDGRVFQACAAATRNARSLSVDWRVDRMIRIGGEEGWR